METAKMSWGRVEDASLPQLIFAVSGSWLNMAEIELSVLSSQCLNRRIESQQRLEQEVTAWQKSRTQQTVTIDWQFTTQDARIKLMRLYTVLNVQSSG